MDVTSTSCRQYDITKKPGDKDRKCMKCNIDTYLNEDGKCFDLDPSRQTENCIWYQNGGLFERKIVRCKKCEFGYMRVELKNKEKEYKCMKTEHCPKFEFVDIKDKAYSLKEYEEEINNNGTIPCKACKIGQYYNRQLRMCVDTKYQILRRLLEMPYC